MLQIQAVFKRMAKSRHFEIYAIRKYENIKRTDLKYWNLSLLNA